MFQQRHLAVCCISPLCNVVIFYRNVNQSIKVAISVAFVSLYVRLSVRPSRSQRITGEPEGLACPNAESRFLALDATRVTSFKVKRSKVKSQGHQAHYSINPSINRSISLINQAINQSINPSNQPSIHQSTNQSSAPSYRNLSRGCYVSTIQSINQSINQKNI